jgi:hypothetical protein
MGPYSVPGELREAKRTEQCLIGVLEKVRKIERRRALGALGRGHTSTPRAKKKSPMGPLWGPYGALFGPLVGPITNLKGPHWGP